MMLAAPWSSLSLMAAFAPRVVPTTVDRDAALIGQLRGGDPKAASELFRRYADEVHRRLTRLIGPDPEREDLVQEVFISTFRGIAAFRGEAAFSTWLHTVVVRVAYTHLRKRKRRPQDSIELLEAVAVDPSLSPERRAALREELTRALAFLDRLKPDKRIAFVLRVIDGLSLQEIAVLVKATPAAVGQRVKFAQSELAAMVERDALRRRREEGP
jgi:RNA polymerase sigma-70 factor, ECF subfamily